MDTSGFEEFTARRYRGDQRPILSMQRRLEGNINQAAYKALGAPARVTLSYDRERGLIGMKRVAEGSLAGYRVRQHEQQPSYLIAMKSFTRYFRVTTEQGQKYLGELVGDMLVFRPATQEEVRQRYP